MNWLVDTNVLSELLKKAPDVKVSQWLSKQESLCISVITVEELYCGLSHKKAEQKIEWLNRFIEFRCKLYEITADIAQQCGRLRGSFLSKGIIRTQADLLIAATAIQNNLVVVTRNEKDFEYCGVPLFNPFTNNL